MTVMNTRWDGLIVDARLATMRAELGAYGAIEAAALGWKDGLITYAGAMSGLPGNANDLATHVQSAGNGWISIQAVSRRPSRSAAIRRSAAWFIAIRHR